MNYKQVEASGEARLWLTQVIVPTLALAATVVMVDPELKETVVTKFGEVKSKIKNTLRK